VHPRVVDLVVLEHAGQLLVHLGQGAGHVEVLRERPRPLGRNRDEDEAVATLGREERGRGRWRAVGGERSRLVTAPHPRELEPRHERQLDRFDLLVADEHRLPVVGLAGHDSSHLNLL
jgi:hypothetical protein